MMDIAAKKFYLKAFSVAKCNKEVEHSVLRNVIKGLTNAGPMSVMYITIKIYHT